MTDEDIKALHIVDQSGQPYGSVRRCCNECGRMCWPGMVGSATRWTDDWNEWSDAEDNCRARAIRERIENG